jgi:hypothetical protein
MAELTANPNNNEEIPKGHIGDRQIGLNIDGWDDSKPKQQRNIKDTIRGR